MVITDLDITQISTELVGGFVSAMLAVIVLINRHKETSMRLIVRMFFLSAALFVFDAFTYLFRGNITPFGLFMTRFSNLSVFFLNLCLAYAALRYIYSILQEFHVVPSQIFRKIVLACLTAAVVILIVNLFTGWMYTFDENNYYHRNWGWYLYTVLSSVCMFTSCVMVVKYRKALNRLTLFSLLCFELFPLAATVIQSMYYGISITNIGIGVSIVLILVAYLVGWNRADINERRNTEQIRRTYDTTILFVIMVICISASIVSCIISMQQISSEMAMSSSQVIARIVSDRIENTFLRPITVTETMSKDYNLQEYMRRSNEGDETAAEDVAAYLESIQSGFGYQMVYAVCEGSHAYYTANGFVKTVDPEHDATDAWYREFIASGQRCALQVDTDEANGWGLSVFINNAVLDADGNLLGVCGVGLEMSELQRQLLEFEEKYQISITIINKAGTTWINSQSAQIGSALLPAEYIQNVTPGEFYLEEQSGTIRLTTLVYDWNWYLTIEDLSPNRVDITKILLPNMIVFLAGIFMLGVAFCVITIRERKISGELLEKRRTSLSDELTGLKNRRALQEDCKELEQSGSLYRKTLILMDLNSLKATNDTLGHQAGDELIIGTAQCLTQALQDCSLLYRTGGDEFVILMECTEAEQEQALAAFDQLASNWRGNQVGPISTAKGIVRCADYPHLNFAALMDMADRQMYEDKKNYYIKTGKHQRK